MTYEELRERVARAIHASDYRHPIYDAERTWQESAQDYRGDWLNNADAAIRAVIEALAQEAEIGEASVDLYPPDTWNETRTISSDPPERMDLADWLCSHLPEVPE